MDNEDVKQLSPLANLVVDKAIDNVNRKLVAGYRNKNNPRPNSKKKSAKATASETFKSASAASAVAVANRGVAWKEMIIKSLTRGISSIETIVFDGEFRVENGNPIGLDDVPTSPGVYVVFDKNNEAVYVGDSGNIQKRWYAGHINENMQNKKAGTSYKLEKEFEDGCTVRYIEMDSVETAAALEAHLIKTEKPVINSREELKTEQGSRSNIEAKKIKDCADDVASLAKGAAVESLKNSGWVALEQLSATVLKALKDELIDVFLGGSSKLMDRIRRFFHKVWVVLKDIISSPLKILEGVFEFVVNALSKAIRQIYMLARNIIDLANASWEIYKGAKSMETSELVRKISETIIVSGSLVIWDALDPIIEANLLPLIGPVAPYLSAALVAIGFGVSSHYMQKVVPQLVEFIISCKRGLVENLEAQRSACEQIVSVSENNFLLIEDFKEYAVSTRDLIVEAKLHSDKLLKHRPIEKIDLRDFFYE